MNIWDILFSFFGVLQVCSWKQLLHRVSDLPLSDFSSCVDLVSHYLAKAKEIVQNSKVEAAVTKEEAFRNTLTLLILLQNPPGDIAAHVKEDVVDGFCEIFASNRY